MPDHSRITLDAAQLRVAETVGQLIEFWGFKRPMGRAWTLLYLAPGALGAAEIGEQLGMSAGAVSMTLAELQKWGVVRRTWKPGERRDFFEAETNIWKMVSRVFRERELALIRKAVATFGEAEAQFARAAKAAPKGHAKELEFARKRIALLVGLARIGETMLGTIVQTGRVDTKPLRNFPTGDDADD